MIITYFRSSSYNTFRMCPQQYFLQYVLGLPDVGGKKAERGTIAHKVFECLARTKKALQDNEQSFEDDVLGNIDISETDIMWNNEWVDDLSRQSFDYYTKSSVHKWTERDRKDCRDVVWRGLDYNNSIFDPRRLDIFAAEPHFDITIEEPWAEYDYIMPDGSRIHGHLAIKGTIDLVVKINDDVYESIDWKTGKRIDWATGETKDFWKLMTDPQLRIYHYALSKMYPEVKQFIPSMFFIDTGGPFTMAYGQEDLEATEVMLKNMFEKIKDVTRPQLLTGKDRWKCKSFCHYGKTAHSSGDINPRTGKPYTICQYIADKVKKEGIDTVIREDTDKNHSIDFYKDPGL